MSLPGQAVCDRSMRSLPAANPVDRYGDALGRVDLSPPLLFLPGGYSSYTFVVLKCFTSRLYFIFDFDFIFLCVLFLFYYIYFFYYKHYK